MTTRKQLSPTDPASEDGAITANVHVAAAPSEAGSHTLELRAGTLESQLKEAEIEAVAARFREELRVARETANARIVEAEVRVLAMRAGMIDPDGVRLLDLSGVAINADGGVTGGDAAITVARATRPWLFFNARTASPEPPPPRDMRDTADARRMSHAEYLAARKNRAWRR